MTEDRKAWQAAVLDEFLRLKGYKDESRNDAEMLFDYADDLLKEMYDTGVPSKEAAEILVFEDKKSADETGYEL